DTVGQETVNYRYTGSFGESKQFSAKITGRDIFDGIAFDSKLSSTFGVNMADTWGRNYNFNMIENTRENIETSFARVARLGAEEVIVHDFVMATFDGKGKADVDLSDMGYELVPDIFANDFRDEGMTQDDLDKLARVAHADGLKIGLRFNLALNNIGDYIGKDIAKEEAEDWARITSSKNKEWVMDFLDKWEDYMLKRAEMLNKAGFDMMVISPTWHPVTYQPYEAEANQRWTEIIQNVKQKFNGKIAVQVPLYSYLRNDGVEDWSKYDFYKDADTFYLEMQHLYAGNEGLVDPSVDKMKGYFSRFLDDVEAKGDNPSMLIGFKSFKDSFSNYSPYHPEEYGRPEVAAMVPDWEHQADIFEAFFQAAEGRKNIARIVVEGYWWDDVMEPDTKIRQAISITCRSKNAEGVIMKWGQS
ncbi:MAG: hypothetical protein KJ922_01090, partial [Nanoarchaeota archaeon]|nr:hypothetical protein [Nanoarchaeota archaeon]